MPPKRKGKKKKKGKKPKITHFERLTFETKIADLKDKIKWRKGMIDFIDNDNTELAAAVKTEHKDKVSSIALLEKAIFDQITLTNTKEIALPSIKKLECRTEELKSYEIQTAVQELKREKSSNSIVLDKVKKKLRTLQVYNSQKTQEKIASLQEKLDFSLEDQEVIQPIQSEEEALREVIHGSYRNKASLYQESLSKYFKKDLLKKSEENRWFKNNGDILFEMKRGLMEKIGKRKYILNEGSACLMRRKEETLKTSRKLQEIRNKISHMQNQNSHLSHLMKNNLLLEQKYNDFKSIEITLNDKLNTSHQKFCKVIEEIKLKERELKKKEKMQGEWKRVFSKMNEIQNTVMNCLKNEVKFFPENDEQKIKTLREIYLVLDQEIKNII